MTVLTRITIAEGHPVAPIMLNVEECCWSSIRDPRAWSPGTPGMAAAPPEAHPSARCGAAMPAGEHASSTGHSCSLFNYFWPVYIEAAFVSPCQSANEAGSSQPGCLAGHLTASKPALSTAIPFRRA